MTPKSEPIPIAITMGCPVGIGPEIIVKLLGYGSFFKNVRPVVFGDTAVLEWCARELAMNINLATWDPSKPQPPDALEVFSLTQLDPDDLRWGQPSSTTGRAMGHYIEEAVLQTRAGGFAAMVTCPITKSALQAAGHPFPGHTEMLAHLCDCHDYAMMMAADDLKVTLVTMHTGLRNVPELITYSAVFRMIQLTHQALCTDFGLIEPRIAVSGLNPHAGENGLFGEEEQRVIAPAIEEAKARGWQVSGPFPPDTVFLKALQGDYDAVVCMYHDQGLIPFKLLHFMDGVNVTLGLPIIRTSVDHGTAYDIAGQGLASPESLAAAVRMAAEIARNRNRSKQKA